ncbi:uncharacterized protein LOC107046353 isoform X2 [Diachasma alloeum]|uniref:uncharacterized protein LOC107046353 isoform X2 n=1 Tax=Diachasma alloeum TaxID=454923 RepID=UPI0007384786|nr:uncharacterized protein LOC107046353 isoform X2 [Diachasma alloeum]
MNTMFHNRDYVSAKVILPQREQEIDLQGQHDRPDEYALFSMSGAPQAPDPQHRAADVRNQEEDYIDNEYLDDDVEDGGGEEVNDVDMRQEGVAQVIPGVPEPPQYQDIERAREGVVVDLGDAQVQLVAGENNVARVQQENPPGEDLVANELIREPMDVGANVRAPGVIRGVVGAPQDQDIERAREGEVVDLGDAQVQLVAGENNLALVQQDNPPGEEVDANELVREPMNIRENAGAPGVIPGGLGPQDQGIERAGEAEQPIAGNDRAVRRPRSRCVRCDVNAVQNVGVECCCLNYCMQCATEVCTEAGHNIDDRDDPLHIPCPLCSEAMEFIQRVFTLNGENDEYNWICHTCLTETVEMLARPCNHLVLCVPCAVRWQEEARGPDRCSYCNDECTYQNINVRDDDPLHPPQ